MDDHNDKKAFVEIPRKAGKSTMMAMLQWTSKPAISSDPNDDEIRCAVLNKIAKATAFAKNGNYIVFRVEDGRVLVTKTFFQNAPLVWFDYLELGKQERVKFWFNESSVKSVLELATSKKELEGCFASILLSY